MENLQTIKNLRHSANSIRELFLSKIPFWKKDPHKYDKTGCGFNEDSRFNACKAASVAFSSHMGTYGDSGCSSQCSIDEKLFQKHLVMYLNRHKEAVMMAIADQIEDEARSLKEAAEKELSDQLEKLKELDKPAA